MIAVITKRELRDDLCAMGFPPNTAAVLRRSFGLACQQRMRAGHIFGDAKPLGLESVLYDEFLACISRGERTDLCRKATATNGHMSARFDVYENGLALVLCSNALVVLNLPVSVERPKQASAPFVQHSWSNLSP